MANWIDRMILNQKKTINTLEKYVFSDGVFTFWSAEYGSIDQDIKIVFRVRLDAIPYGRAKEKQFSVGYVLYPAMNKDIELWIMSHSTFPLLGIVKENLSPVWLLKETI